MIESSSDGECPAPTPFPAAQVPVFGGLVAVSTPFGGQSSEHSPALDAMAAFMLGLVVVIVGGFTAVAVRIHHRTRFPEPATQLLDEIESEAGIPDRALDLRSGAAPRRTDAPSQPWEREDDWWRTSTPTAPTPDKER